MSRAIIVVPCYNEAMRLDLLALREFAREHPGPRFLFVNDGSTDGTRKILDELHCEVRECFLVCHLRQNVGKAEAVRQGLLRAFEERPDYVGYWDADLATPLAAILTFCSILDFRLDIDMVFGARVCLLGREVVQTHSSLPRAGLRNRGLPRAGGALLRYAMWGKTLSRNARGQGAIRDALPHPVDLRCRDRRTGDRRPPRDESTRDRAGDLRVSPP